MNTMSTTLRSRRRLLHSGLALISGSTLLSACTYPGAGAQTPKPLAVLSPEPAPAAAAMSTVQWIEVWKTPTCGCCQAWVEHLQREGFTVKANDVPQTAPIRAKLGIPDDMGSCHTALIAGFAIEGHVPASEIKRLLTESESLRQQVIGLSVPGMPIGSPGMEMGTQRDKFDVMLVLKGGQSRVYQSYSSIA